MAFVSGFLIVYIILLLIVAVFALMGIAMMIGGTVLVCKSEKKMGILLGTAGLLSLLPGLIVLIFFLT